jgi:glycine oxidase
VTTLARWSQAHYHDFAFELFKQTGIEAQYTRNGLLILDTDEYPQARAWAAQEKIPLELLDNNALHNCEPKLGDYNKALWMPEIAQIRNPRLLKALKQALVSAGIKLLEQHTVLTLQKDGNKIIGAKTEPSGFIAAQRVILTAGAWSAQILKTVGTSIAVKPVRGQMISFLTPPGLVSRIVLANDRYIIPRRDGYVLVGSTVENVGFDKTTTDSALEELKSAAFNIIPQLADYKVQKQFSRRKFR